MAVINSLVKLKLLMKKKYLLVNFGGPRTLNEIEPFLKSLLLDQDVIRTGMPKILHRYIFQRVAKKRVETISKDYVLIGGGSPIYADTVALAEKLEKRLGEKVLTFHRYLPMTHKEFFVQIEALECDEIVVFPLFPQFTYATTGSIARLFEEKLSQKTLNKMRWIKSYPSHKAFVQLTQKEIRKFLSVNNLKDEETILLFSAHGVPKKFIETGDLYLTETQASFQKITEAFPKTLNRLCYQSKFGPDEWLKPYTVDLCETVTKWHQGRQNVLFVPISFTSDHIETLYEIEHQYMTIVKEQGLLSYRLPAFNGSDDWIEAIVEILSDFTPVTTSMLVRRN